MIAHVVAWEYEGGGGFDWYHTPAAAEKAYLEEIKNADQLADCGWTAFRFDVDMVGMEDKEAITRIIDGDLIGLCDKCERKHKGVMNV